MAGNGPPGEREKCRAFALDIEDDNESAEEVSADNAVAEDVSAGALVFTDERLRRGSSWSANQRAC
jgi:hypothetical protein